MQQSCPRYRLQKSDSAYANGSKREEFKDIVGTAVEKALIGTSPFLVQDNETFSRF
jgi:hypothetical protein